MDVRTVKGPAKVEIDFPVRCQLTSQLMS